MAIEIESESKGECYRKGHQTKKAEEGAPASHPVGDKRHDQTAKYRSRSEQHCGPGGQSRGLRRIIAAPSRHFYYRPWCINGSSPESDPRDQEEKAVQRRSTPVLLRKKRHERFTCRSSCTGNSTPPALRFLDSVTQQGNKQRRYTASGEHGSPTVARAQHVIKNCCNEHADVESGVQVAGPGGAAAAGELLSH